MPVPRPRRVMCLLCIAICESVASSFGVSALSSTVVAAAGAGDARVGSFVRGGAGAHSSSCSSGGGSSSSSGSSSRSSSSSLSITNSGLHEGGGKGLLAAQALADLEKVQPVAEPVVEDELERAGASDEENDTSRAAPLPLPPPPTPQLSGGGPEGSGSKLPSIQDGVKMELGKFKAEPFEDGTFPPNYLYALQRLRSEDEEEGSFGAAFISLRAANDRVPTRTWNVGRPNAISMMSLARFKLWWMMPKHTTKANEVPPETQMMLTKLPIDPETGVQLYGLFIPLIDGQAKCSLKGLPDRSLQLFAETGCPQTSVPSTDVAGLYVAVHEDPFKLVEKSFKLVNTRLRNQVKAGSFGTGGLVPGLVHDAEKQLSRWKKSEVISKTVDKTSPDFSQYLGWCTWDSFYTRVDHDKVFQGLTSLKKAGIYPKWLVLDDGWQSTSNIDANNGEQWMDHLTSIVANKKFRDKKEGTDLSRTVKKAKKEFGVDYFLVWHAITGYWAGVDLDSPALLKYKPRRAVLNAPPGVVEVDPDMKMFFRVSKFMNKRFGVVPPEKIRAFYEDYHRYLSSQGVDGIKVDAQSVVNFLGPGNGGSVMLSRAFHSALSKSVRRHFFDTGGEKGQGGRIIHCMCHDSEILLQLPACYGRQPVIRGSDDFYPRDKASHSPHIYANAFNGLMISNCGLQDWDMFQTNIGEASWMHAAARAVSGGPVYISDRPGDHNTEILKRMVLEDGGILKPPANALPCLKCLFTDPQREPDSLLSVWNEGEAAGHGVVALFNLYGSAWSQGRRTYAPVRTPSGALSEVGDPVPVNGETPAGVRGGVSPSDCHRLLRDHSAAVAGVGVGVGARVGAAGGGEGFVEEARYATHLHFGNRLVVGGLHEEHSVVLTRGRSEIATISKVLAIDTPAGQTDWASIGLVDMFNAGGAIASETVVNATVAGPVNGGEVGETAALEIMVRGKGRFLAVCSLRPAAALFDGQPVEFSHGKTNEGVPYLELDLPKGYTGTPRRLAVHWDADSRA